MIRSNKMNKQGQVAIWIIIALVIVALTALIFVIKPSFLSSSQSELYPQTLISSCISEAVNSATDIMLPQGGFIAPLNYKLHDNIKVSYLCQNIGQFRPCINQHPLLISEMEGEIANYITPKIDECFTSMKDTFQKQKYSVSMGDMTLNVSLMKGYAVVDINRSVVLTKNGQSQNYDSFQTKTTNPSYEMARVAEEIADQEAKYCYFEYVGYSILYPQFTVRAERMSDDTKIYSIEDKYSTKEMNLAIRGCSLPAGI